jgi:RNA-splicing ligase RtcB
MRKLNERLYSWASVLEEATRQQSEMLSRLPILAGHVALMPDAHLGIGSTVGSVIPTEGAIIPAAIGVDIGCGMIASRTSLNASDLPDTLDPFVAALHAVVPAGLGKWHAEPSDEALAWYARIPKPATELTSQQERKLLAQLGTLGSGNHFFEVCLDQHAAVWIIMHSGSRGIGNQLANLHMKVAERLCAEAGTELEHRDLSYLQEKTPEFDRYIADMRWAQAYARENRRQMVDAALGAFFGHVGTGEEQERINCHHNFTEREVHQGREVWITRKGAIRAGPGDLGLIPGAMGGRSYVVRGRGNPISYQSCAHGAGRRMSRGQARKTLSVESLAKLMEGSSWQPEFAERLLDEHPESYKDIDQVMSDQADLVEVLYELRAIANYKGTNGGRDRHRRRRKRPR